MNVTEKELNALVLAALYSADLPAAKRKQVAEEIYDTVNGIRQREKDAKAEMEAPDFYRITADDWRFLDGMAGREDGTTINIGDEGTDYAAELRGIVEGAVPTVGPADDEKEEQR